MPTPNSSATAYVTPASFLKRKDPRTVGDLVSRTDPPARVTPTQLLSDPVLAQALLDASGMAEAAFLVGAAYSIDDLQALTGAGQAYVERLISDLAMGLLFEGRPDRKAELPVSYLRAEETLELIRRGERVLGLVAQQDAGTGVAVVVESADTVEQRAGVVVEAARLFSRRNARLHG